MRRIVILTVIAVSLIVLYRYLSAKPINNAPSAQADLILYWGNGCPHCEKVKEYITSNKIDQKVEISLKEVYYNQQNQKDLESTVGKCPEINTSQGIGVPLAFDPKTQKCISGDEPIISWLAKQ